MNFGTDKPRVLLVGPYNMDNLGDFLLLLATERYLSDADVVFASPFGADMTALVDRQIHSFGPLLDSEKFDIIWTVGAQIGGIDLELEYSMFAPQEEYMRFQRSSSSERQKILREAVGGASVICPFMPAPTSYVLNASSITVLNSAGIADVLDPRVPRRLLDENIALLRGTTFISVRDKESSDYLNLLGLEHRFAPDVAHAISVLYPKPPELADDVAILQMNSRVLSELGPDNVGRALAQSENLRGLQIRVLLAGTFRGGDSFEVCDQLVRHARAADPSIEIDVITDRRPFELVDHIRTARVVIGTAFHVRVAACAYKTPRVTIAGFPAVTNYARTWDKDMPYGVSLPQLDEAIGEALRNADRPDIAAHSDELAHLADDNIKQMVESAFALVAKETPEDQARRLRLRREHRTGS